MPPVAAAGVNLAKIVLGMVMASILLLVVYLLVVDVGEAAQIDRAYEAMLHPNGPGSAEQMRVLSEAARQMGEQRVAFRTFWLQTAQLILLNLLLPLVTALLGYIFGTNQLTAPPSRDDD